MKKLSPFIPALIIALICFGIIAMQSPSSASQSITITKPVIISGTTYTTGTVTVDDATARLIVNDGKATYVTAPAGQNVPDFYTPRLSADRVTATTYRGITQSHVSGLTTSLGLKAAASDLTSHTSNTTTAHNLSTFPGSTYITTIGTLNSGTIPQSLVTGLTTSLAGKADSFTGVTSTCTGTSVTLVIANGIITAATCTP